MKYRESFRIASEIERGIFSGNWQYWSNLRAVPSASSLKIIDCGRDSRRLILRDYEITRYNNNNNNNNRLIIRLKLKITCYLYTQGKITLAKLTANWKNQKIALSDILPSRWRQCPLRSILPPTMLSSMRQSVLILASLCLRAPSYFYCVCDSFVLLHSSLTDEDRKELH
jgi:hypothetical protein